MIVSIVVIFVACILFVFRRKRESNLSKPPFANGAWPFFGHVIKVLRNLEELNKLIKTFSKESTERGGVITLRMLSTDIFFITDPTDARIVLSSTLRKDSLYSNLKPWLGEGLISASENIWKKHSKLISPTFSQAVLENYLPELNKLAKSLVVRFDEKVGKGKFNHADDLEQVTLESICSTAMGAIIDERDVKLREQYLRARQLFVRGVVEGVQKFWLHSKFLYKLSSLRKIQRGLAKTLRELTHAIIKKRENQLFEKEHIAQKRLKPFIDYLLDLEKTGVLTRTEVQEEVETFTFAGSDTISVTLTVVLLIIATYPEVQRKIGKELRKVFLESHRDVGKEDLMLLKYLEAVVKETLRLYPAIPLIGRTLDKEVKTSNYTLPSGCRCFVSLYGVNRHPSWGPDVDQFRPERWLDSASLPAQQFASFGFGRRRCIGNNFAMMSIKTILSHVLRHYWVSGDVTELVQTIEVVARPVPKNYITIERIRGLN